MFKDKIAKKDIKSIILFSLALPVALVKKEKYKDLWLISERHNEARDNGYWFFKYVKENIPNQKICYVIDKNAKDQKKMQFYGDIIAFGTFKHYVVYLMASKHISAHVNSDSPNSRVSNFLETHGLLKNKRVFLQHGITKDKISFGYYSVSRADLFVCAAKPEFEFCKSEFGYPEGAVQLLGFARFDGLGKGEIKRQILLMPTWRSWLANVNECEFKESVYYRTYQSLLFNKKLKEILMKYNVSLMFYPHPDMQKFISLFETDCSKMEICHSDIYSVQELLNESAMLVTDYSSVAFDMAYMGRPVCYYHFDYNEYRREQHPEGYYTYEKHGFGVICKNEEGLVQEIMRTIQNNFEITDLYTRRQKEFFAIRDRNNCKRIYKAIKEI